MLAYLYNEWKAGNEDPLGAFMIVHGRGLPDLVPVRLTERLDLAEKFLAAADEAVAFRFGNREIPPMVTDSSICQRCPHVGRSCFPPLDYGDGVQIITDERLHELAETYLETRPAAERNAEAWDELRSALRGVERAILADKVWTGSWRRKTGFDVPPPDQVAIDKLEQKIDALRAPYKSVNPHGSFVGKLEKIL